MPVFKIKATGKERLKAGRIYVIDNDGKNDMKISLIKGPNMSPSPPVNVISGNSIPELKPFDSIEDYWSYSITNVRAIGILGQSRSGKTGMAYKILNQYAGPREICVYQHPNPIEIEKIKNMWGKPFKNVRGLLQLETMNEFIIWIDEPQLHFKNPDDLIRFISVVSHHDGTIIFTSNETRWFAARMEDHIDVWIIKNCYYKTIKRGGVAQDIIKDYFWDDPKKFRLAVNEYIFWSRDEDAEQYNGLHTFTPPSFFNDNLSKPYRAKAAVPQRAGINCKTSSMGIEGVI